MVKFSILLKTLMFTVLIFSGSALSQVENEEVDTDSSPGADDGVVGTIASGVADGYQTSKEAILRPWQFLVLDLGPAVLNSNERGGVRKTGSYAAIKTLSMFDFNSFIIEAGFGFATARLSAESATGVEAARLNSFLLESGARWRVTDEFELGGLAQWVTSGDNEFRAASGTRHNLLAGIQAAYELGLMNEARTRVSLSYLFDTTLGQRNFRAVTVGFHIGLPWIDDLAH
jgi:hypothetical protein